MRAVGNRNARRRQITVDRPRVTNVDTLARGDVAHDLALNDDGLRENRRLDLAVRADGQNVLTQFDLAFDLSLDREIFAPGQIGSGTAVVTAAGCAAPASCPPLRTYPAPCASLSLCTSKYTSLAGDDLITSSDGHLTENTGMVAAFDRSGAQGCSGTPITCAPRWATRVGDPIGPPAVAGGSIYQAALEWCSVPEECAPRATLTALDRATGAKRWVNPLSTSFAGIAVADGWVHEAHSDELVTYRDPGTCITTCPRHHRAALGGTGRASLAVANGMVFVGNSNGVSVFDVAGVAGCTPAPIECSAVAHVDGFWTYELSIALGNVWAVDSTGRLHALGLD